MHSFTAELRAALSRSGFRGNSAWVMKGADGP